MTNENYRIDRMCAIRTYMEKVRFFLAMGHLISLNSFRRPFNISSSFVVHRLYFSVSICYVPRPVCTNPAVPSL